MVNSGTQADLIAIWVVLWVCWGRMVGRGFGFQTGDGMGMDAVEG